MSSESEETRLPQTADMPFLVTASELRDRKALRRRRDGLPGHPETIRRLVELGLKGK
jgi:hypothetical protein